MIVLFINSPQLKKRIRGLTLFVFHDLQTTVKVTVTVKAHNTAIFGTNQAEGLQIRWDKMIQNLHLKSESNLI